MEFHQRILDLMTLENKLYPYLKYFCLFLSFNLIISCDIKRPFDELSGSIFGTFYNIKFFSHDDNLINKTEIDSIFSMFDNSLSTYIDNSTISKVNNGENIELDNLFIDVFNKSKVIYNKTGGMFDPSIGNLLEYYGFGPDKTINEINSNEILLILQSVGFDKVSIVNNKLVKQNQFTKLDFNAIAKGYAVDIVGEMLESNGVNDYMINIGGEIRSMGKNHFKDSFWKIGIENPEPKKQDDIISKKVKLNNVSIASSGNYRNYRVDPKTGIKYVHTINPLNGKSQQSNILSASVISKSCFVADAYATAMMVGNLDYIINLTENNDEIESLIIYFDSNNNLSEYISDGFKELIIEP